MKTRTTDWVVVGVIIVVLILAFGYFIFTQRPEQETVKIGYAAVLSGPAATQWGFHARDAAEMALEEINKEGNVKLEIFYGDSAAKPEQGVSEFKRLNDLYNIDIFIVDASAVASAIAPLVDEYKKPIVFGSVAVSDITDSNTNLFRNFYICDKTAPVLAQEVYNNLGIKKVVIISQNDPYGQSCSKVFADTFNELGGEILSEEKFLIGDSDFRTQLTKLSSFESEAIYIIGYPSQLIGIVKQMKELDIDKTILGELALYTPEIRSELVNSTNPPLVYLTVSDFYFGSEKVDDFEKRYQDKYGKVPTHVSGYMYDTIYLIGKAAEIASQEKIPLREALTKVKIDGVNGILEFDEKRESTHKTYFVKLNNDGSLSLLN